MKPTAPLRNHFNVLAPKPCRGANYIPESASPRLVIETWVSSFRAFVVAAHDREVPRKNLLRFRETRFALFTTRHEARGTVSGPEGAHHAPLWSILPSFDFLLHPNVCKSLHSLLHGAAPLSIYPTGRVRANDQDG